MKQEHFQEIPHTSNRGTGNMRKQIESEVIKMENGLAQVAIKTEGANAAVYLDGKKVNGLIGYEIIHDRTKSQVPVIRLNIQANLDIETGMIPELPEPWKYCYVLKDENDDAQILKEAPLKDNILSDSLDSDNRSR